MRTHKDSEIIEVEDENRDPITGTPGAHPVGVGLGAVAGGAATGAVVGSVAGPVGTAIGVAVGAVAGGLAGKGVAEAVNPTEEVEYWRVTYRTRPYYQQNEDFEEYEPAYRYGWESTMKHSGKSWDAVEQDLARGWESARGRSKLAWDRARLASRDAWDRVSNVGDDEGNTRG